jgi:hypothetical protein
MVDAWCTAADVLTYAKATVDDSDVLAAQATIDVHAGRIYADAERIGARDRYWLKLATAYQAAWLKPQPDAFTRLGVESTGSTNGVTFAEDGLTLAPNAVTALRRVSWLGSRSLRVRAPGERRNGVDDNYLPGQYTPL